MCHGVLGLLADRFAPVWKIKKRCQRLSPWMVDEYRLLRRRSLQLERRYRRSVSHRPISMGGVGTTMAPRLLAEGTSLLVSRNWVKCWPAREPVAYLQLHPRSRLVWQTPKELPFSSSARQCLHFLHEKVAAIRFATSGGTAESTLPPATVIFDAFDRCTTDQVMHP